MGERGVDLDHATLNRWVGRYASVIAEEAHHRKAPTGRAWRMDETSESDRRDHTMSFATDVTDLQRSS